VKPFSELTGRDRSIEGFRWLCVLPAAVLANFTADFVVGAVVQVVQYRGWDILGGSIVAKSLTLFLFHVPPESAFVIAGAKMAPRHQRATAMALTLLGFLFSLMTHVISQQLSERRVGIVNYLHLSAESAGLLGGATYILLQAWKNRRLEVTA
jgi:hypothetical protein